jgi:cytochrome c-type biogenesis protein CcmH/NrfG
MRRRFTSTTFFIAAALCAATAAGQSTSGANVGVVKGTLFDPNGAVIVGARVLLESRAERREVSTDDEGVYAAALPEGTYTLTAAAAGFCPFRETRFRVESGGARTLDVTLKVAASADILYIDRGKRDELRDPLDGVPCTIQEPPASNGPGPSTRFSPASAQRRKPSTAPSKTPPKTAAKPATRSAAKSPAKAPAKPPTQTASKPSTGVLNVSTQPGAAVWVDELRRGTTDAEGKLSLKLTPGRHALRVRAKGFAERTLALLPAQRGALNVELTQTADEAELAFQQAEEAREKGNNAAAVESYRQALKLRPRFAAAHLGLARALESQGDTDGALEELKAARADRPVYPESWAVEGRIERSLADYDAALAAFARSLREARGFQPEAHTGAGLVYEEQGRYDEAVESFRKALAQLSDTEPVVYELLGRNLEKLERWKEAVAAYEKYLELAPEGPQASAINSIIDQLRRQAAEAGQQQPPN